MSFDNDSGRTHWGTCWRDPEHHACAVANLEREQARVAKLENTLANVTAAGDDAEREFLEDCKEYREQIRQLTAMVTQRVWERDQAQAKLDRLLSAVSRVCDPGSPGEYSDALSKLSRLYDELTPVTEPAVLEPPSNDRPWFKTAIEPGGSLYEKYGPPSFDSYGKTPAVPEPPK